MTTAIKRSALFDDRRISNKSGADPTSVIRLPPRLPAVKVNRRMPAKALHLILQPFNIYCHQ